MAPELLSAWGVQSGGVVLLLKNQLQSKKAKDGIGKSWLYGQFSEECIYDVMCYEMYSRVENMKPAVWDAEKSPKKRTPTIEDD